MAWRLARSLETLRAEVRSLHPGTRVDTIGDQAHASGASDHNPNSAGVVCAADFFADKGLNLAAFAAAVVASKHPALKYVIYNRRIWSVARAGEGWRSYTGSNPHTSHVHVSVGTGPDGRSTGPYDNTSSWGLASLGGSGDMLCKRGDSGPIVEALQHTLRAAGFDPGPVDGEYGDKTAAAVLAARKADGSAATDGNAFTGAAYSQLLKAVARANGREGPRGPQGPAGAAGPAGPAGPQGPVGEVDYARLVDELLTRLAAATGQG